MPFLVVEVDVFGARPKRYSETCDHFTQQSMKGKEERKFLLSILILEMIRSNVDQKREIIFEDLFNRLFKM